MLTELSVLAAQGGSEAAFRDLHSLWTADLRRPALGRVERADATDDVLTDVWLAIARGLSRLDDPACFPRWAFRIVDRRCTDWIRRRSTARRQQTTAAAEARAARSGTGPQRGSGRAHRRSGYPARSGDAAARGNAQPPAFFLSFRPLGRGDRRNPRRPARHGEIPPLFRPRKPETTTRKEIAMNNLDQKIPAALRHEDASTDLLSKESPEQAPGHLTKPHATHDLIFARGAHSAAQQNGVSDPKGMNRISPRKC